MPRAGARQFEAACDELRSSEGWQRFAKARALLRGYSLNNTVLILAPRPDATTVASYRRCKGQFDEETYEAVIKRAAANTHGEAITPLIERTIARAA